MKNVEETFRDSYERLAMLM